MSRHTFFAAVVAVMLAGCATAEQSPFAVHVLAQDGAPVQITNIERSGDNLLGRMTVQEHDGQAGDGLRYCVGNRYGTVLETSPGA